MLSQEKYMIFVLTFQFFNALEITFTRINAKYTWNTDMWLGLAMTNPITMEHMF